MHGNVSRFILEIYRTARALTGATKSSPCKVSSLSFFYWRKARNSTTIIFLHDPFAGYALQHSLTPFISMQNHYSLVYREEEREMFPALKHFGVGSLPWSPLARGFLTRPYGGDNTKRGDTDS